MHRADPYCFFLHPGVCAGICAWNGSHVLAAWKMAPAMAAGNTFVLKSSEKSPLALAAYGDLINEVSPVYTLSKHPTGTKIKIPNSLPPQNRPGSPPA